MNLRMSILALTFCFLASHCFLASSAFAQQKPLWPPEIDGTRFVYKTIGERELCVWKISSEAANSDQTSVVEDSESKAPAIIFFFGGGWSSGTPEQFLPQARYLASRGMVTFVADYRVSSRDGVKASACVEDAKSAVRWLRKNAAMLGLDADRICAAGGSAGGHIACATALLSGFEAEGDDTTVSSVPNALALFNPAVVLSPMDRLPVDVFSKLNQDSLRSRMGAEPEAISPAHHVRPNLPPTVIFHGEADTTVPIVSVEKFTTLMLESGNRCELIRFPGAPHGFFNFRDKKETQPQSSDRQSGVTSKENKENAAKQNLEKGNRAKKAGTARQKNGTRNSNPEWYHQSLRQLDEFLVSLGWLETDKNFHPSQNLKPKNSGAQANETDGSR